MIDAGVGDHPLEAGLGERDQRPVDHRDHPGHDEHGRVLAPRAGQHRHRDPEEPVGAHLQQHSGQDRRPGRGSLGVGRRQPGVKRRHRRLDRESEHDRQQHQVGVDAAAGQRVRGDQGHHVEGVRADGEVQADEPQQQRQRPGEGIEEELERRRAGPLAVTPAGDDEVHPDDGQVEVDEEQDQVQGREQAQADGLQEQEEAHVALRPAGLAQRVDGDGQEQHGGHRQQRQRQTVHADVVADPGAGDPPGVLRPAEPPVRLVVGPGRHDQGQVRRADAGPRPAEHGAGRPGGHGQQPDGGQRRQEHDRREHRATSPR